MITAARFVSILAASSLAAVAYAQTQPAPSTQPNAAPGYNTAHPHQRQMTSTPGNETASPGSRSAPGSALNTGQSQTQNGTLTGQTKAHSAAMRTAEAGPPSGSWSNMPVQSSSGQSLGSVSSVVPGLNGKKSSGYVVVSGSNGESVPVPYRTAHSMVRDGKLILSQSRFSHAPKVTQEDLQNSADHAWRAKADHYWESKGHGHHSHGQS
jgi:hypothetical protein